MRAIEESSRHGLRPGSAARDRSSFDSHATRRSRTRAILYRMVKYSSESLDAVFGALSDPTRRAITEHLAERGAASVSELAEPFPVTLPAIVKHLYVLERAGLVENWKEGR